MRAHFSIGPLTRAVGAALVLFNCVANAVPAKAGDIANLAILGFSADGKLFAFEEYGELDGSGQPYANRFYIDTTTDDFVGGSPIRVRLEEGDDLLTARSQARREGEKIIPDAVLAANAGFLAGYHAITEASADAGRIVVQSRPYIPTSEPLVEFRLEELPVPSPQGCENMGDVVGLRLLRIDPAPGGVTRLVHEDKAVPASRGCPTGYQIGAVQFSGENAQQFFAVLIALRRQGFEGPDFRWLAFTGRL